MMITRKAIAIQHALVSEMERSARVEPDPKWKASYQRSAERDRHRLAEMEARLKEDETLRAKPRPTNRVFPLPLRGGV